MEGSYAVKNFNPIKSQNDLLVAIIDFNIQYICKTVPDNHTITIEQYVQFQGGMCLEDFQIDIIKNDRRAPITMLIDFIIENHAR